MSKLRNIANVSPDVVADSVHMLPIEHPDSARSASSASWTVSTRASPNPTQRPPTRLIRVFTLDAA